MINNNIKQIGSQGERKAKEFLISNNYEIIKTNFHSPYGEIDIIAQDDETLVFIEVKTRSCDLDSALNSISISKRKKISKTASYFLSKNHSFEDMFTRFDVIIIITSKTYISLKHIKEAFIPTF
jgi:putative endonuclease